MPCGVKGGVVPQRAVRSRCVQRAEGRFVWLCFAPAVCAFYRVSVDRCNVRSKRCLLRIYFGP